MKPDISLIKKVLNLPTAPFHEEAVIRFIKRFAKKLGRRCQQDEYGNLKIIYKKGKGNNPFALTAHMDHPGFEVIRGGQRPIVQLLGGVPDRYFKKAKVIVWNSGEPVKGRVVKIHHEIKRRFVVRAAQPVFKKAFGSFDLPAVRLRNGKIFTKAADDMINVALLLNFLESLVRKKLKAHLIFIFTRAEEVGFVGALGAVKKEWIPRQMPILVLEASSAKAGNVQIGAGPVLRVGDKSSTFSHTVDLWLQSAARNFPHQRALLPGGRCESTIYMGKGYLTGCLALPLGNYHNIGKKSYAPEFIHLHDYQNMLLWLFALIRTGPPWQITKALGKKLDRLFAREEGRLKNKPQ